MSTVTVYGLVLLWHTNVIWQLCPLFCLPCPMQNCLLQMPTS